MAGLGAAATGNVLQSLRQLTGLEFAKKAPIGGAIQQALGGLDRGMARRDARDQQDEMQRRAIERDMAMQRANFDYRRGVEDRGRHDMRRAEGIANVRRGAGNRALFGALGMDVPQGAGAMDPSMVSAAAREMMARKQRGADASAVRGALAPVAGIGAKPTMTMMGPVPVPLMAPTRTSRSPTISEAFGRIGGDASAAAYATAARAISGDRSAEQASSDLTRKSMGDEWNRAFKMREAQREQANFGVTNARLQGTADELATYRGKQLELSLRSVEGRLKALEGRIPDAVAAKVRALQATVSDVSNALMPEMIPALVEQNKAVLAEIDALLAPYDGSGQRPMRTGEPIRSLFPVPPEGFVPGAPQPPLPPPQQIPWTQPAGDGPYPPLGGPPTSPSDEELMKQFPGWLFRE